MSIRIGTASWAAKTLIDTGRFYPPQAKTPAQRLRYYATQFPLVEVDTSFYGIPAEDTVRQWALQVPAGFTMNVKAFRLFTNHQTSPAVLPADLRDALPPALKTKAVIYYRELPAELLEALWQRFEQALRPLREAGLLGLVHFQFPPWLVRNRAGQAHVALCAERMAGCRLGVEFRNRSWLDEAHAADTLAFQRSLGVVHTIVDEPQGFTNSVPAVWQTSTEGHALVRLHGRNAGSWNISGAVSSSARFDYDYDDAELEGLAHRIIELDRPGLDLQVVLNNNAEDQAQRNGRTLMKLFAELGANLVTPGAQRAAA
ncbi:DUF72 domain-containing protein [Pelomonas sp. KK5]|uniref:DUF72 domain-containing protein n=1 Tax=Pelomonas sp. KK5 TaxID=1855730 RepID=UPI00097C161A|nr:DUF72 domain-containing protein [Pelomonas sp. KK5]